MIFDPEPTAVMAIRPSPADASLPWHTLSAEDAAQRLGSDLESGLAANDAAQRLARDGPNEIREQGRRSLFAMIAAQFKDFMILVLIAAALVSGLVGDAEDTFVIVAIVLLNAMIGFIQDFRAERAMAALKRLAALKATVLRDGHLQTVPAAEIVAGDIVLLEAGSAVPADLRLIAAPRLKVTEAALTGESVPIDKRVEPLADPTLGLADRTNMAFKGTTITYGRARGVAVATGMATELGKIAGMIEAIPASRTPLQRRLAHFGRRLAIAVLAICAIVFAFGIVRGTPALLMLLTALSLAVAAIPEALPAVVTVMLALGARTMARRNALVRRLPAVETLGAVSCICTDKTGTLTRNEMHVAEAYLCGARQAAAALDVAEPPVRRLIEAAALCNDAGRGDNGTVVGDPTEIALWRLAAENGLERERLEGSAPRVMELPFDSDRKRMTTLHRDGSGLIAYTKGAPEAVLARCMDFGEHEGAEPLLAVAEAMAGDGLRVLAVAGRRWDALPHDKNSEAIERDLAFSVSSACWTRRARKRSGRWKPAGPPASHRS
jgi:Ca2+-transporting ATPase